MARHGSIGDQTITWRTIEETREELQAERAEALERARSYEFGTSERRRCRHEARTLKSRIAALQKAEDEAPTHETMINERYFKDYARELAQETSDFSGWDNWPFSCIDWDQVADQLRSDYYELEIEGETYLYNAC